MAILQVSRVKLGIARLKSKSRPGNAKTPWGTWRELPAASPRRPLFPYVLGAEVAWAQGGEPDGVSEQGRWSG